MYFFLKIANLAKLCAQEWNKMQPRDCFFKKIETIGVKAVGGLDCFAPPRLSGDQPISKTTCSIYKNRIWTKPPHFDRFLGRIQKKIDYWKAMKILLADIANLSTLHA